MVALSEIEGNLKTINSRFNKAKGAKQPLYYSKLAVIELCGWVEVTVDDMVLRYVHSRCRNPRVVKIFESKVKQTHGFDYKKHVEQLLVAAIGVVGLVQLESIADKTKLVLLENELSKLTTPRNDAAHNPIRFRGVTRHVQGPSVTLAQLPTIFSGLKEIEACLRKL
jgi:hypothetical protein